jgi:hypothetical protein
MMRIWMFSLLAGSALSLTASAQSQPEEEVTEDTPPVVQQKPPEPAPTREPNEDSPYDYRASEEISEDLSVSFPVDI